MASGPGLPHFARVLLILLTLPHGHMLAQTFAPQPDEPASHLKEGKVIHAFRIVGSPPAIDGDLSDEAWTHADTAGGFIQRDPDNGLPMSETTRVQIAYDERYLYVALICDDTDPARIADGLGRRDDFPASDYAGIALDPRHDHLTGYLIETNPSGVQRDYSVSDDDRFDLDYNAVWEVRTQITGLGWTAEFRLPFSQMRFTASPAPGQVWGMNARRQVRRKSEFGTWVAKPRGERGEVSLFGHLVFDEPLAPPRRVEIVPYALARGERLAGRVSTDADLSAGADVRIGLGQGATLSATVNPDFGQVEQDPAVLNLSVFETFFPEKRAFFLEDSRTFVPNFGLFQLFHSRRIGRAPGHFSVPSEDADDVVDEPDETTIYGAAKITGKSGTWTYGGLTAFTGQEVATIDSAGARREHPIEPATSYNVARVQRDVMAGSSTIGAIATGVLRDGSHDAYTGGFDYTLRWDDNRTVWNGHWVATRAPVDGRLETSGGGVTNFSITHKHWNTGVHYDHFGDDFRVSDLGFFRARANRHEISGNGAIEQPDPWKMFRRMWLSVGGGNQWTRERLPIGRWMNVNAFTELRTYWGIGAGTGRNGEVFDDLDTRGGPAIVRPASRYAYFNVSSDSRKSWRLNFGGNGSVNEAGGREGSMYTNLSLQPLEKLQVSVGLRYDQGKDSAQWIRNEDTTGDGEDDHVYGTLHRNVLDLSLRGTYSFSRDLTVQAYLQPFVASGDYRDIRRLARPRSYEFEPAVLSEDPDFNDTSVRGNVVLRWEYLRGSTLFVVWDLSQSDDSRPGQFRPFRDIGTAFGADATHVVLVKVSYWLNR